MNFQQTADSAEVDFVKSGLGLVSCGMTAHTTISQLCHPSLHHNTIHRQLITIIHHFNENMYMLWWGNSLPWPLHIRFLFDRLSLLELLQES